MPMALASHEALQLHCVQSQVWRDSRLSPAFRSSSSTEEGLWQLLSPRKCHCPAFLHQPVGWGDSKSMHPASCCLMAEAARCYSHSWGLSRVPISVEGLLMGPVLHCVHCRD